MNVEEVLRAIVGAYKGKTKSPIPLGDWRQCHADTLARFLCF